MDIATQMMRTYRVFLKSADRTNPDSCWVWKGPMTSHGYGRIRSEGMYYQADHYCYEFHNNCVVPYGQIVVHTCENPLCVNPKHMKLVEVKERSDYWSKYHKHLRESYSGNGGVDLPYVVAS